MNENPFPEQVMVELRFEIDGETVYARKILEARMYDTFEGVREHVHRELKQKVAEEIMKRYPHELRVHR